MNTPVEKSMKIAVLMGGMSSERKISLKSGKAVLEALLARGWDAVGLDVNPELPEALRRESIDVAYLALHGQFGEDGAVQGLLEIMRIPYTGSGVAGSATAMDKIITKRLLVETEVHLPRDSVWRRGDEMPLGLDYPVVAKTPEGGSTIGIAICGDEQTLHKALPGILGRGSEVLLEQYVAGREITVTVLDGEALPIVEIIPESGFFDFEAKYTKGRTKYEVPANLPVQVTRAASEHAVLAYNILGLKGVARADFIVDDLGVPWFLEVNTIPGMTATSLSPMAAGAVGITFGELAERVLVGAKLQISRQDGVA